MGKNNRREFVKSNRKVDKPKPVTLPDVPQEAVINFEPRPIPVKRKKKEPANV